MKALIFVHIPKCAGNGMKNLFRTSGFKTIEYCRWLCAGSGHAKPMQQASVGRCNKNPATLVPKRNTIYMLTHHRLPRPKNENDFIFACIRNPYDWYVSRWSYHISVGIRDWGNNPNNVNDFHNWLRVHAGLYTQRFSECCIVDGNCIVDLFIKIEDMAVGIQELNKLVGTNIRSAGRKVNASKHLPTDQYYTPELRQLVNTRDAYIFSTFSYTVKN